MGAWSEYPDGNDSNIDIFASLITRYFVKTEDPEKNVTNYADESNYDPGLQPRMALRIGESPIFTNDDLTNQAMDIYLAILKMYAENLDDWQLVGLAISLARVLNNENFGIGMTALPKKNLLRSDINEFIKEHLQFDSDSDPESPSKSDSDSCIQTNIRNFFNQIYEVHRVSSIL